MNLHVLVIRERANTTDFQEWYFENHAHFLRAKAAAESCGVYVGERVDYTTDLDEFLAHLETLPHD